MEKSVFAGGSYEEVGRWLRNFLLSHAKRESPRVEAVVEIGAEREGKSYGLRLSLGNRFLPPLSEPAVALAYAEVAEGRGSIAWCAALATRVRALARDLVGAEVRQPAQPA